MIRTIFAVSTLLASVASQAAPGQQPAARDPAAIVALFDSARAGKGGSETVLRLTAAGGGTASEKRFRVLDDGRESSIVEFLDPLQRGTKVLSTARDLWLFTARTRRAIKIPPLQRLFGEASYGDIARLRLASDYAIVGARSAAGGLIETDLRATTPGATYDRVRLTVRAGDLVPVRADYFVASGKHLRTVEFVGAALSGGRLRNDRWRIYAPDMPRRVTEVVVERAIARKLPAAMFSRRALEDS